VIYEIIGLRKLLRNVNSADSEPLNGPDNGGFGNDSNLLIVFYVQIMPDDLVMQLHRF